MQGLKKELCAPEKGEKGKDVVEEREGRRSREEFW